MFMSFFYFDVLLNFIRSQQFFAIPPPHDNEHSGACVDKGETLIMKEKGSIFNTPPQNCICPPEGSGVFKISMNEGITKLHS